MYYKTLIFIFILVLSMTFRGCHSNVLSTSELELIISKNLKAGDSQELIISLFENEKWDYSFDKYARRWEAVNPEEKKLPSFYARNGIYIYINQDKEFLRFEVEPHYSGLVF